MPFPRVQPAGLVVGGYPCPTTGEIAGRTQPSDNLYFLTEFGGGADTQNLSCSPRGGPRADGTWYYIADSWRFGCGTRVRITNPANGKSVVAQVADVGPNICIEQAAGKPVIDASPLVTHYLFGRSVGWSDHALVRAEVVPSSTALGPTTGAGNAGAIVGALVLAGLAGVGIWLAQAKYPTRARKNPSIDESLSDLRISEMGYPQTFRLYGGSGRKVLDAFLRSGVRIPLALFMVMEAEFARDPKLNLYMETGPGFRVLFIERTKSHSDPAVGRREAQAKLTRAQLAAFTHAGMEQEWLSREKNRRSPYRVLMEMDR